jgi:peptidoglycan/xylan/chitin deacetylase (PgdA/CDA1 family)
VLLFRKSSISQAARYRRGLVFGTVALASLCAVAAPKAHAVVTDPSIQRRNDRATYLLHLMDQQRYAEAAQGVQQLFIDYPTDAGSYEVRGVLQLHVGAISQAQKDFEYARATAATNDPIPAYGLALCAIFTHDYDTASNMLSSADAVAQPTQHDDITIAKAMLAAANDSPVDAVRLASTVDSVTAREIVALAAYASSSTSGLPLVEKFVADGAVNDVPRVIEEAGLRYIGPGSKSNTVIEPSLTESVLQAMFAQRLAYQNAPMALGNDSVVMSTIALSPSSTVLSATGLSDLVVTISVDDHLLGMVNSAPYEMSWDTRSVTNGTHVIKFEISDTHGAVLQTQYKKYKVANAGADLARTVNPFPPEISAALWNMMQIHPAYKAAEYTLAEAYLDRKDKARSVTHLLITAALDSEYRNAGAAVQQVFSANAANKDSYKLANASFTEPTKSPVVTVGEFWQGSPKVKEVALTFDDGPSPILTPPLLDNLKKAGVPGTFFVVGMRAALVPDILHRMRDEGHEVENHTYTHPNLDQAIPTHIIEEYLRNGVVIRSLTGRWPKFLRPPGGNSNPQVMDIAHKCGMIGGFWTLDALHAEDSGSSKQVSDYVLSKVRPGAIILMHNGAEATTDAIPGMVAALKAKGYKCVTLSQLAKDSGITLP